MKTRLLQVRAAYLRYQRSHWPILLRGAFALALLALLYAQLRSTLASVSWVEVQQQWLLLQHPYWLILAVVLMPINWLLEARKWQTLHRLYARWSLGATLRAVLAGVAVSTLTPNRVGEYGGRALVAPSGETLPVLLSSLLGSLCQWLAFLSLGGMALAHTLAERGQWSGPVYAAALLVGPVLALLLIAVVSQAPRSRIFARWVTPAYLTQLEGVNFRLIAGASVWAGFRYGVYSLQYYCLLVSFGLAVGPVAGIVGAAAIFLVQAGLPLPPGLGIPARAELALLLWGHSPVAHTAIVLATVSIFLLNVVPPALLGTWFIINHRDS